MRPLIVRLPNWVGDVIMSLPTLWHLHHRGYALQLVGKRWAATLLAGCGWPVHTLPGPLKERVRLLRRLRQEGQLHDPDFGKRLNTLLLTNSFSSAFETWLAGLNTVGYRQDGRGWFLTHPVPQPAHPLHESQRFWGAAATLTPPQDNDPDLKPGTHDAIPSPEQMQWPHLPLTDSARERALTLLYQAGLLEEAGARHNPHGPGSLAGHTHPVDYPTPAIRPFAILIPFATGTLEGNSKAWPGFPALCRQLAERMPVLLVPGPGAETARAHTDYPTARSLDDVPLDVYAALLSHASLVVANDTGPGHVAAAVGAPLLSVLGPTNTARYRALGPHVHLAQSRPWPSEEAVWQQVAQMLAGQAVTPPGHDR